MKSLPSMGMMTALALAASAGTGNAVEVIPREPSSAPSPSTSAPRNRKARRRLNVRVAGGNWQGQPYLSYAEHDQCVRATFGAPHSPAKVARYDMERRHIVATR